MAAGTNEASHLLILWVLSSAVSCLEDRGTRADVVRSRKIGFPLKPVSQFGSCISYPPSKMRRQEVSLCLEVEGPSSSFISLLFSTGCC